MPSHDGPASLVEVAHVPEVWREAFPQSLDDHSNVRSLEKPEKVGFIYRVQFQPAVMKIRAQSTNNIFTVQ